MAYAGGEPIQHIDSIEVIDNNVSWSGTLDGSDDSETGAAQRCIYNENGNTNEAAPPTMRAHVYIAQRRCSHQQYSATQPSTAYAVSC